MKTSVVLCLFCLALPFAGALDFDIRELEGQDWYGLYMNGKKVGYASHTLTVSDDGRATFVEDASFKLNMAGIRQDMHIFSERIYSKSGALLRVKSQVDDISGKSVFEGIIEGNTLVLSSNVGGLERVKTLPKPKESLRDLVQHAITIREGPEIGATMTFTLFEPLYEMELEGKSEVIAIEHQILDGVSTKVYKVKTVLSMMGIESVATVDETGRVLEDHIAGGIITMRLESEEMAKDVTYSNDVIISNAAKVDVPIRNPRNRAELVLSVRGPLTPDHLFNDHRQQFESNGDAYTFRGRKVDESKIESAPISEVQGDVTQWLEPTLFVQSDSPRLRARAAAIVDGETDAYRASKKLSAWVYDNVRTTFSARLTNSLEVLDHMEGDCTEHSMLFIGLARAAGIPAREAAGLIYVDGPEPGFYFHQWATVWVGEWIDVDPTFDQPIADATHIKLAEGDIFEQAKLLPIIGQLSIEAVE